MSIENSGWMFPTTYEEWQKQGTQNLGPVGEIDNLNNEELITDGKFFFLINLLFYAIMYFSWLF